MDAEATAPAAGAFKGEGFRRDGFIMGFGGGIIDKEEGGKGVLKGAPEGRVDNQSL